MTNEKGNGKQGRVIGLHISRMDPLDSYDPGALATQMAQHMQRVIDFKRESEVFAQQAVAEEKKVKELAVLIEKVNERRKLRKAQVEAIRGGG